MGADSVLELSTQALELALRVALPLLLVGLVVGLAVSIFQAVTQIKKDAIDPLQKHKITQAQAFDRGQELLREFMFCQTRTIDLALFVKFGKIEDVKTRKNVPTYVLIPAFIISELKTAFQMAS